MASIRLHNCDYALFVHDAHKHGAQLLGLAMLRDLAARFGKEKVVVFLLGGGDLEVEFQKYNCIRCSPQRKLLWKFFSLLLNKKCSLIFNSVVTQSISDFFLLPKRHSIALIHELPTLIEEYGLRLQALQTKRCDKIVFPGEIVKKRFIESFGEFGQNNKVLVFPQGVYQGQSAIKTSGTLKNELGISPSSFLVTNIAYGDLRKAPDVFIMAAISFIKKFPDSPVHFLWIGEIEEKLKLWIKHDVHLSKTSKRIHFLGFRSDPENIYKSIDCLFLSSREDPLPSTILEAYFSGKPIVLFNNCTGYTGTPSKQFFFSEYMDINSIIDTINELSKQRPAFTVESIFYSSSHYLDKIQKVLKNEI